MMMRKILLFLLLFVSSVSISGQNVDKRTIAALEYIQSGYIQCGVEELGKAILANDLAAQYFMAKCYENGIGVQKDLLEAFKLYRQAAERGLPDAMYCIAPFYKNGIVVRKNESRGDEWLQRFRQKGGMCSMPDVVALFNQGLKHPENYALNPGNNGNAVNELAQNNVNVSQKNPVVSNVTIVQQVIESPTKPTSSQSPSNPPASPTIKSDVDMEIPQTSLNDENTFALIIANEEYQSVVKVPNALNDGNVFAEYCEKSLGIPKSNIHVVLNATLNNIKRELNLMKKIATAYKGKGKFIVYYAGHGLPDESTRNAYLVPIDGYGSDMTTCYSLGDLYSLLGQMPASQVIVLLDACFSGSVRGDGMLASARGVAIKAKAGVPKGKMVVLSAAQGDETAYPYKEQGHGLFTYYLLKKLKETKGSTNLGDLFSYIKDNVTKKSLVVNGKQQTPSASSSSVVADSWKSWNLK